MRELCSRSPEFGLGLARAMAGEAAAAWEQMGMLGQQSARERIAHLLLELHGLVRARGGAGDEGTYLPLSQILIADATGLTPVHVCRTLKQMRLDGLLEFQKGHLRLLDPERLARIAELEDAAGGTG
jgi:CRP-like cAMP-binding protein